MRSLVGELLSRLERKDLKIVGLKLIRLSLESASELYKVHRGKSFYNPLVEHMTSGPVVAIVVEGPNVVRVVRGMIGATNPLEASPGTIRGDLALVTENNIIHASDSLESAEREMSIFFSEEELAKYEKPSDAGFLL